MIGSHAAGRRPQAARGGAQVDQARAGQAHNTLRAPLSGTVLRRNVEPGQTIEAATRLMTIADLTALITIVIGVASALVLATYRRRPEIGIMRAMGAGQGVAIFVGVAQGALVGLLGGVTGAALGYLALLPFPPGVAFRPGALPVDITQGSYGLATTLTVTGAILASILPARAASRVDPVTAIGH